MRAVYLDPVGGAAGDMILGALIDAGAPSQAVEAALRTLPWPADSFALEMRRVVAGGMHATQLGVAAHGHGGRTLGDLLGLIGAGRLPGRAAARAAAVFERLAAAEAKVHAEPIAEVHFHEVGAIDAVVDIVGTAVALELLHIETLRFGRLAPGHGVVVTHHGPLSIPAPATLELLTGVPIELGGPPGEWVTPTGAAILVALGSYAPAGATMAVERIGVGAGQRMRSDRPNVVRVLIGEWSETATAVNGAGIVRREHVVVLESALDDLAPAALAFAVDELRRAGALDVHMTPITMKKGRLGTLVTVLSAEAAAEDLAQILLRSTTALGVRMRREERRVLGRTWTDIETPYGLVRMKETERPGGGAAPAQRDATPEADDVARAAAQHGVPFGTVAAAAKSAWEARGSRPADSAPKAPGA